MPRGEYEKLKREYERLSWKIQTSPLSKDRELQMVRRLEEMEVRIKEYEASEPVEAEARELKEEIGKIREEADAYHKRLLEESEKGEKAHKEMHEVYKKVDKKREKAKNTEEEFIAIKKELDGVSNRFIEVLNELRKEEEKLGIARAKERKEEIKKIQMEKRVRESDLLSELKNGKVITTEDLLILQETDRVKS